MTTASHPIEIQVGNIEQELTLLWEAQQKNNQIRACLFNLIIFSQDPRRAAYLYQIVQAILEKFPCRIIFIQAVKDSAEEFLRATVSNAIVTQGDVSIVCDQINIDVSVNQLFRVPFVVLPLLVPDLPVFLAWGQNPTSENIVLPHLQRYASRLIFDSESAEDLPSFSQKILKLLETTDVELRDVKWAALGGWREILYHTFDTPEKVDCLRNCHYIQIAFNQRKSVFVSHTEIPSIYLQAWIAARFGWSYRGSEADERNHRFYYENGGQRIEVALIPKEIPEIPAGGIASVHVVARDDTSFLITRKENQQQVAIYIETRDKCEMPFFLPLNELKSTSTFMNEIFYRKTSEQYKSMLEMTAQYKTRGYS